MSSTLFKRFRTIGAILLVAFFALVILMFGVTPKIQKGFHEEKVAHVDKHEITRAQYLERKERIAEAQKQQLGEMYGKFLKYLNLEQRAIDSLIDEILIDRVFKGFNMVAGSEMLRQKIAQFPFFASGEVTKQGLRDYIRRLGMSSQEFEDTLKREILDSQLRDTLRDLGKPTLYEMAELNKAKNTKKAFDYVEISSKSFLDKVKTDNEEPLKNYYQENQEKYRKPRAIKFSFVKFPQSDFQNSVEITDDAVAAAYEEKKSAYREPKSYKLRKILIRKETTPPSDTTAKKADNPIPEQKPTSDTANKSAETKEDGKKEEQTRQQFAESLRARLEKGEQFSQLASEFSEDEATKKSGGDLGWINSPALPPNLKPQVEKLDVNGYSSLINTPEGYEIVYLEDIKQPRDKELTEIKDLLISEIKREEAPMYAQEGAQEFLAELESSKKSMAELSKEKNRPFTALDKPVNTKEPAPGIDPSLVQKAFELGEGEKNVISIAGNSYVVEVEQIVDALVPELSEVKDAVIEDYKKAKSKELAKEQANALLTKLTSEPTGKTENKANDEAAAFEEPARARPLAELAKAESLEVKSINLATQQEATGGPFGNPETKRKAFQLSMKQPTEPEVMEQNDSFFIVQLTAVEEPKTDVDTEKKIEDLQNEERNSAKDRLYKNLVSALRNKSDVWIDPKLLEKQESNQ